MAKKNTHIQINGKQYDALSGALLSYEHASVKPAKKSIDGVVGGKPAKHAVGASRSVVAQPVAHQRPHKTRVAAKHAVVKQTKPSATLMRHAVKKPAASLKSRTKVQASVHHTSHTVVIPKTSINGVNHLRAKRAAQHVMSPRVSHFNKEVSLLAAAVKADASQAVTAIDKAIVIPETTVNYRPDIRRVKVVTHNSTTSDIFEQALLRATSHEQPAVETPKSRGRLRALRRRMVSFTAGAVAVLAIVGVFGFQKHQTSPFTVASHSVGFSTTMPGYQPQGFKVNKVQASGDTLFMQYADASAKNYIISEKQTTWSSQTLLQHITQDNTTGSYAQVQSAGRTIYLFGRNQAAWVHNGVLYQVLGNGVLSSQDFTQIASSM